MHYKAAGGADFLMTENDFNTFYATMYIEGKLNFENLAPVSQVSGMYILGVDADGTKYENTTGHADLYFSEYGVVGFGDSWNFEPQASGSRTWDNELKTFIGSCIQGVPFYILYGIHPAKSLIGN